MGYVMAELNPIQLIGQDAIKSVDLGQSDLPFSSKGLQNQALALTESMANTVAGEIEDLGAGVRSIINQQAPFPGKKIVTFFLLDKNGNLVIPTDGSFQPGYLFNMAVNPSNLNITYPPKSVVPVRTMGGWVLQHWYPDLGSLTAEGIIGTLLQRYNTETKKTPNWNNFKKLIKIYQNNSIAYQPSNLDRNNASFNPTVVCVYDRVTYKGYFENFSYSEEQEQPFTRRYNWSFKFLEMIETQDIVELTRNKLTSLANNGLSSLGAGQTATTVNNFSGQQLNVPFLK